MTTCILVPTSLLLSLIERWVSALFEGALKAVEVEATDTGRLSTGTSKVALERDTSRLREESAVLVLFAGNDGAGIALRVLPRAGGAAGLRLAIAKLVLFDWKGPAMLVASRVDFGKRRFLQHWH